MALVVLKKLGSGVPSSSWMVDSKKQLGDELGEMIQPVMVVAVTGLTSAKTQEFFSTFSA